MNIFESILMALDSVRLNKLRSSLTLLSIAIGVFAIIGVISLVNSLENTMQSKLAEVGNTTFYIYKMPHLVFGNNWRKYNKRKPISYSVYQEFAQKMTQADMIGPAASSMGYKVKAGDLETDNDVTLVGSDEKYFRFRQMELDEGRIFLQEDISLNRDVTVIGNDIAVKIFPTTSPIGKKIKIGIHEFTVIGTLKAKGAILGQSQDNFLFIPVTKFLKYYADEYDESLNIMIRAHSLESMESSLDEAIGLMRTIRNLKPYQENDFEIDTNESITEQFAPFMFFISFLGIISGGFALLAAGIGIMNIMLVSVKERTREIGIRKAVGAKRKWILIQFLIEAVTICQLGGIIGIILGYITAFLIGNFAGFQMAIPVTVIIFTIIMCSIIGIISGVYPAWKAAKINPIDALRYE